MLRNERTLSHEILTEARSTADESASWAFRNQEGGTPLAAGGPTPTTAAARAARATQGAPGGTRPTTRFASSLRLSVCVSSSAGVRSASRQYASSARSLFLDIVLSSAVPELLVVVSCSGPSCCRQLFLNIVLPSAIPEHRVVVRYSCTSLEHLVAVSCSGTSCCRQLLLNILLSVQPCARWILSIIAASRFPSPST